MSFSVYLMVRLSSGYDMMLDEPMDLDVRKPL